MVLPCEDLGVKDFHSYCALKSEEVWNQTYLLHSSSEVIILITCQESGHFWR